MISLYRNLYLFEHYAILTHAISASRCSHQPQPNSHTSAAKALLHAVEKFARGPFGLSTASVCDLFYSILLVISLTHHLLLTPYHRFKPQTALASCLKPNRISPLPPSHALSLSECGNLFILNAVIHYDECVVVSIIVLHAAPTCMYAHTCVCHLQSEARLRRKSTSALLEIK